MISTLTRSANETPSRNMERQAKKWFEIMTRKRDVTLLKLSAHWIHGILYSLGMCVADPDTFVVSKDYLEVFGKGNPPCNVEDNLRAGHLVMEAWFRSY